MKQAEKYMNPESLNLSIEEFDAFEGTHEFSEEYKKNKRNMLRRLRKGTFSSSGIRYAKVAVAASFVLVFSSVAVNAATDGELFGRLWGNMGKSQVASHEETVYEAEKDSTYTVTYPQREYEEVDPEKAEKLVGDSISTEPIVKEFGDTTLTILSSVVDGNAAVVEFTLERAGGVNALYYSQLNNEAKGADFTDDADFYFGFAGCSGSIFVDLEKSTEDKLYCYNYMTMDTWDEGIEGLTLETYQYPCTRKELYDADEETYAAYMAQTKEEKIPIPVKSELGKVEYANADGGLIEISPISMMIDAGTGLGLSEEDAGDPYNIYYISINYKDGTNYVVSDEAREGIHECDTEIDNTSYVCGSMGNDLTCVFNRLVDTENIESITVNETKYELK